MSSDKQKLGLAGHLLNRHSSLKRSPRDSGLSLLGDGGLALRATVRRVTVIARAYTDSREGGREPNLRIHAKINRAKACAAGRR